jgi:ribose transport system substrate-binding protein
MKTANFTFLIASFTCLANPAAQAADRTLTFGVIAKANNNPVFQVVRVSAEAAAKKLTAEKGVPVKIDWRTPDEENAQRQAEAIEQLVNAGASGIAVSCSDANKLTPAIDDAVTHGVPVVTFDSDAAGSKRFAFVGVDDVECGHDLCRAIAKEMNNTGVVAVLAGNPNAPNLQRRIVGLRQEAANYPGLKILDTFYHKETPQDSIATVEQVMQAHPEVNGWAMLAGWALFSDRALKWTPGTVKLTAIVSHPATLQYIREGYTNLLLAQQVYEWGVRPVDLLFDAVQNGKYPATWFIKISLLPVTKDNVDDLYTRWKGWLQGEEQMSGNPIR